MFWFIITIIIVALDQLSKYAVVKNIEFGKLIPVIEPLFYLTYHENKGAAWGILQNKRFFFIILTVIALAFIVYFMVKMDNKLLKTALSFILGGAVGNLIERIYKGSVTDFLDFYFGAYHFPTFNVADSFITIGTILLAYYLLFVYKEPEKKVS